MFDPGRIGPQDVGGGWDRGAIQRPRLIEDSRKSGIWGDRISRSVGADLKFQQCTWRRTGRIAWEAIERIRAYRAMSPIGSLEIKRDLNVVDLAGVETCVQLLLPREVKCRGKSNILCCQKGLRICKCKQSGADCEVYMQRRHT